MEFVADLMTPNPVVVSPSTPIAACARMMARLSLRHLPVVHPDGKVLGVLTDFELFSRGGLAGAGGEVWMAFDGVEATEVRELPLHPMSAVRPGDTLAVALRLMCEAKNEALLVTEPPDVPVGILTEHDGVRLAAATLPPELRVGDIASRAPLSVGLNDPIQGLLERLAERQIRHLLVLDGGEVVGVLSSRDVITANQPGRAQPRVRDILVRRDVVYVGASTPLFEAAALMVRRHIGCLPVTSSHGAPTGILTRTDLIRSCVAAMEEQALFGGAMT